MTVCAPVSVPAAGKQGPVSCLGPEEVLRGVVFNIQRYSLHDGPGIRTTVFLKGCPLDCLWCHNPEGISHGREISLTAHDCIACGSCVAVCPASDTAALEGRLAVNHADCSRCGQCVDACPTTARRMVGRAMTVAEVVEEAGRDRVFHEESGGGVTLSGGEPLAQPAFAAAVLAACRSAGMHTALDTSGFCQTGHLLNAAGQADVVLYDLKAMDDALHQRLTGVSNRIILENLRQLDRVHRGIRIRVPVIPGLNDDSGNLAATAAFAADLEHVTEVNLLPYHRTGAGKLDRLARPSRLPALVPPSHEAMARALAIFTTHGLPAKIGG